VADDQEQRSLLSRLGKHKMGKSRLRFKQLADLDGPVLEKLVVGSVAGARRRDGQDAAPDDPLEPTLSRCTFGPLNPGIPWRVSR